MMYMSQIFMECDLWLLIFDTLSDASHKNQMSCNSGMYLC